VAPGAHGSSRWGRGLAALGCVLASLASACGAADPQPAGAPSAKGEGFLAVMQAAGGRLEPAEGEGAMRLTLENVAPRTLAFTDRPQRVAAEVDMRRFVERWNAEYQGAPPNAALSIAGDGDRPQVVVLEVSSPSLEGRDVRFAARSISPAGARRAGLRPPSGGGPPEEFEDATLFVDAGGLMQLVAYGDG
jgi:hypothetical protein